MRCTCITSSHVLQFCVRFEAFTAVTMKNGVFWDITQCDSCKNRRFGGTQVIRIGELGKTLAVTSSPILVTLMKEVLSSSETSVLTRATWHNIPKDTILYYSSVMEELRFTIARSNALTSNVLVT
jgi:hypothetical protein